MIPLCKYKRYIIMMKSMKLMKSILNNLLHTPASRACRTAFLVLVQFILCGNIAIAQDISVLWEGTPTTSAIQISGATLYTALNEVIAFEGELDVDATYVNVYTSDDGLSVFKGGYESSFLTDESKSLASGQYYNSILSCYSIPFSAFKAVFYTRDNPYGEPLVVQNSVSNITKITFYSPPDDFYGTYSGSEPTVIPIVVATDATSKVVTFTIDTENAKYARFVLMRNGVAHDISRTAITVSGGQSSAERPKRGVYVYNSEGLGSSIDVTLTLDAGTFYDYQLVGYFSDEAPTLDDATITQEPATLDEKKIYSFSYPIATIDKYIAWNTNTTTIDLASLIAEDLPTLTSSSTTGYIGWSVYDGPYGSGSLVNIQGNHWNASVAPAWAMDFTQGATQTVWSVNDGAISSNWAAYTNVPVYAPGSQKFEEYPNYIVVAEVSDVSSSMIKVRYIFHFNADGQAPYELINETDIAADKTVMPITDYEAASGVLDVSDALVSGAKYARIYVSKYGNANAESANLTITYDGAPITQCAAGNEKYGWYLSEAGGIDVSKLSLTGLTADEMLKYNVVIVSSDEELSGTREPAWDKKKVYSFQKDIRIRVEGTDADQTLSINHQDAITTTLGSSVSDFSKYLYAKWYVLNPSGEKVSIGSTDASNSAWRFDIKDYSIQNWTLDGNELKYFTDNASRKSSDIEGESGWASQIAKISQLFVPFNDSKRTIDYAGYKIVFEFSDEYDTSTGIEPAYKLKYTTVIIDPNAFTGELSATGVTDGMTQEVARDAASLDIDLTTGAFAHSKLSGIDLKYARFYLTDANGNVINPVGKLAVQYDGADVTACTNTEEGFYIYLGPDGGGTIQTLDKSKISVTLTAPKTYKLYKVVGVFSTEMTEVLPEGGATPLTREPDWELQYTYDFSYPNPTTKEIAKTMEWRRTGMTAHASTTDPDADWDTSWEELSTEQYVKWYVVNGSGVQQPLVEGNERLTGTTDWAIDVEGYTVADNAAVLTGQSVFTSIHWNTWSKPAVYAPAGVNYDDVADYQLICEIYTKSDGTGNPNARYTFSLYKSFLGELKDTGGEGGEIVDVLNTSTSESLPLSHATTAWGGGTAKYARVWLTTVAGEMVDPTGILSVAGMTAYATEGNTDVKYGYYLSNEEGIDLSELAATVKLDAGFYNEYQVHVALSTEPLGTSEPDYNYIYTYGFSYPVKTKYKTLIYDSGSNSCTPHLLGNWQELAVDCSEGKTNLADKLYVRWYLTDLDGNEIPISNFTSGQDYTAAGGNNGYYRKGFDASNFNDEGSGTAYNPTITLPGGYTYDQVRVVCVATTKTDGYTASPWSSDPEDIQVKYVYTLHTQDELENQPFVHYQGEGYRYLMNMGEKEIEMANSYDYIKPAEATGVQGYIWDSSTNSYTTTSELVRQNVHTVDYYYYLNLNENETASLILPLQHYADTGNDTEPRGYFRWYDYKTDAKSANFANPGSNLVEKDYGYIALPSGDDPTQARIGIDFKAPSGFSSLTDEILIACDVSRYMDGMDDSYTYLVHEPTLSIRYMFHILPASVIADEIEEKANANSESLTGLAAVEEKIMTKTPNEKISILENDGRVVISTNNGVGDFSLRTDLSSLGYYYVKNGGISAANQLQWYAYYQDADGNWWKKTIAMDTRGGGIQAKYSLVDFTGEWTRISGSSGTTPIIGVGDRVQMVACVGDGTVEMPIIWTELVFIDAAPQALGSETTERTVGYMNKEYTHAKTLDFNEFFRVGLKTPENSFDNYTKIPLEIPDAQYGFCYPQLYGLCATNKFAGWGEYGIAPLHGDYTLLKSMNMYGISQSDERDIQNIYCRWWWWDRLFDVTHERASGKGTSDTNDYGAFLYVDAADEARTIATLEFDAALCHDAKIYYTAYVASMTNNITKPMVRFRVLTDDDEHPGERVPVVAFVTGDLYSELGTDPYESDEARVRHEAQWYQVYGYTTIPSELNNLLTGNTRHYYVEIDNYCDNTEGADYCVDQISFYTYSAKVRAEINNDICDGTEEKSTIKITADAKTLIEQISEWAIDGKKTVFYRIYEKFDDVNHVVQEGEELTGEGIYTSASGVATNLYGAVTINVNYDWQSVTSTTPIGGIYLDGTPNTNSGFYKGTDGEIYFQFAEHDFVLEPGKKYYVSFYDFNYETVNTPAGWGNPYNGNACSVFSNDIIANKLYLDLMDGESEEASDGTVNFGCGATLVTKTYAIKVQYPTEDGSYRTYSDIKFDFFLHASTTNAKTTFNNIPGLREALDALRDIDQNTYTSSADLPAASGAFTAEMRELLVEYMDHTEADGKLLLSASTKFNYTFTTPGERHFAALPVDKQTSDGDEICSPIDMKFIVDASIGGPQMTLGFDDVDYPASYTRQVIRVGLEQLRMMKEEGYKLHIPVRTYRDKSQGTTKRLYFPADPILTISAVDKTLAPEEQRPNTSDPVLLAMEEEAVGKKFAEIVAPSGGGRPYVNKTHMYLPLDLSECEIDFHEGYEYEVSTSFMDEDDESAITPCYGDLFLVIKVVPEFVTWDAQVLGTLHEIDYYNASWYYDDNWKRSGRTELYKGAQGSNTNTPSAGHPGGYENNEEIDALLTTSPGYVPMKFTYVTLLTDNHAPNLIGEPKVTEDGKGSASQGGALIDPSMVTGTQMYTDPSPFSSEMSSYPTENIRYDMLVRYGTHTQGGVGCFGHRYLNEDGTWGDDGESPEQPTAKVFDVEKFYGNICKEIYFKPRAELLKQNRLTYEKAWVEKELIANKWYLMSSPLKATYAGDMYVPYNSVDAAKNGRQESEAFQNIEFSTAVNAAGFAYSRTKYPIYQRSWGQTAKVYTKTNDIRSTDYSAKINFGSVTTNLSEWGHTYNDVEVPYTTKGGFSIRAQKKAQKDGSDNDIPALIRLPKYDTSYDYYQWDNTSPTEGKVTQAVTKGEDYARLLDITEKQVVIPVANLQAQGTDGSGYTYYLVGNPFMSSIDMGEFFKFNSAFDTGYYTYEESTLTVVDATDAVTETDKHLIKPLQAFFLKCAEGDAPENVVFHTDMMVDGNYGTGTVYTPDPNGIRADDNAESTSAPSRILTLQATNNTTLSKAKVILDELASETYVGKEDVETLFDSNLSDVATIFTISGDRALSIDVRPKISVVPFGVACADMEESVTVTFEGTEIADGQLYLLDAMTGEQTAVDDGVAFTVVPNEYGRYFIMTGTLDIKKAEDVQKGVFVSVCGHEVTVTSSEDLNGIRALSLNGATMYQVGACGKSAHFSLNTGVYIIKAENTAGDQKTVKIMVK